MNRILNYILRIILLTSISVSAVSNTAFVNVTVIPMDSNTVHEAYNVIVKDDRITAVGPKDDVEIPDGMPVIEAGGKFLIPGFAEMHGHLPDINNSPRFAEHVLFLYVANGITTVRGMQGAAGQFELRKRVMDGELIGPTLYLAGPSLNGRRIDSPIQAANIVRQQKAAGWDSLKIHEGLTMEEYDAIVRTAKETGIRFGGHVPNDVGIFAALVKGQHTIDHMDNYLDDLDAVHGPVSAAQLQRAVQANRASGAAIVPTQALWKILYNQYNHDEVTQYPEIIYMPKQTVQRWLDQLARLQGGTIIRQKGDNAVRMENRDRLLKAFDENDIPILFGTDSPQIFSVPGFSIHHEIDAMKNAGLSDYAILRSATAAVGNYYAEYDSFGTIESGNRADLILLNSNPMEDASRVRDLAGVMVRGNWLSAEMINKKLEAIADSYR